MILLLRVADRVRRMVWRLFGPRTVGVRGLVADDEGRVLLVRHSYGSAAWHLPGGGVKRRETLVDAVRRELREETAVEVLGAVRLLGTYSSLGEGKSDHISVFVVDRWTRHAGARADAEIADLGFFASDALPPDVSPATRRRVAEWRRGSPEHYDW